MKLRIAFLFVAVAIGLHFYLTNHFYELQFGISAGDSVCNVGGSFNCDTTSASPFAQLFGIPIAAWGLATNAILLVMLFGWMFRWTDDVAQLSRYTYYLSAFVALMSLVMGGISSFVLGSYCLFCMGTYFCSFATFALLHFSLEDDPQKRGFLAHLKELAGPARTYVGFLVAIPIGTVLVNAGVSKKFGGANMEKMIRASIADWKTAPAVDFDVEPSIIKGASDADAKFVIAEFADFRCGHCKNASPSIRAFVNSRKDVQVRFYNFPLDNTCNPVVGSGDGVSCLLAKSVTCAEKVASKGWPMHDAIFGDQVNLARVGLRQATEKVMGFAENLTVSAEEFKTCIEADETNELIKQQAELGEKVGVRGTPAFYANDRKLPRGQALPVLERAYTISR